MPVLNEEGVQELLRRPTYRCNCGGVKLDYCRTCDEFYWIHRADCTAPRSDPPHEGHRLTIVPYVEACGV